MTQNDVKDVVALANFLLEERSYTVQALCNEMFLYTNFVESQINNKLFNSTVFEFIDGDIQIPEFYSKFGKYHELHSYIRVNDSAWQFTKGKYPWNYLNQYRNLRNVIVGK